MSAPARGVALVSGAGSGIGRACALALAGRGHSLGLLGRRLAPLEEVLAQTEGSGVAVATDVRDAAAVEIAVRRIEAEIGPVEVVVPAAGVARVAPFTQLAAQPFDEVVATNLLGCANLLRAVLPAMLERRHGTLVPILSVAARRTFPGWSAYSASKWGLLGLVETLREELAGSGLRILALTPGATVSPLWDTLPGEWDHTRMMAPEAVVRALLWGLELEGAAVEEIRLRPPGGDL